MDSDVELARSFFRTLQQTERLPPADLHAYQADLLRKVVAHAAANTPYYRETLGPVIASLDLARPEHWRKIPTTDRKVLAARRVDFHAAGVSQAHGNLRPVVSGGSTGAPIQILLSDLESTARIVATYRMFDAYHMDPGLPLIMIRPPQFGSGQRDRLTFRKWSYPWLAEETLGERIHVDITTPAADQLLQVQAHAPTYLNTLPSNLLRLALEARRQKRLVSIPIIISVAEYLPAEVRALAQDVFGSRVIDVLSSSEAGVTAIECPVSGQHHVQAELVFAEVLDESGEPCASGETGELVVTPFYNYASPVIRYRTGDFVVQGGRCSCGRTLPTLAGIVSRREHLFLYPDGRRARPPIDHVLISERLGHDIWQLEQVAPAKVTFRYVAPKPLQTDEETLGSEISAMIGRDFDLAVERCGSLPLTSGGKRNYLKGLP